MKYISTCLLVIGIGLSTVSAQQNMVRLVNSSSLSRPDEPIIITRDEIAKMVVSIPVGMLPYLRTADGKEITCQADDLNGDGMWDEVALLYSFQPKEKVQLQIMFATHDLRPKPAPRAHAHLGKSLQKDNTFTVVKNEVLAKEHVSTTEPTLYQLGGPGWENDKVGFRLYFDGRNTKDILGKTTSEMILEKIGLGEDNKTLQPWGMKVLEVGSSLGAGALALWESGNLIRLGGNVEKTSYELIANGPARAIIRLKYEGWQVNGRSYNIVDEITIWGGKYWYQGTVTISGANGERTLVTGVVNSDNTKPMQQNKYGFNILATPAVQSTNNDKLSMGIMVKNADFIGYGEAPSEGDGITHTHYVKLKAKNMKPTSYYFFAGWEKSNKLFAEENTWITYMEQEAERLADQPIKISKGK